MDSLEHNPSNYEAQGMADKTYHCSNCKKDGVTTFQQLVSTMPQDTTNMIRKYRETFCAYCGTCLDRIVVDETVK